MDRRADERVMTLVEAARWCERRFGRRPNAATVWRWALKGLRGVRLHTISLGRFRYTTERALEQFIAETSSPDDGRRTANPASSSVATAISFTGAELTAARRHREAAKEKAKEFLRQRLGPARPRNTKPDCKGPA